MRKHIAMLPPLVSMRGLTLLLLVAVGGEPLSGNAQGSEEVLPSEVKALIGMRIPPKAPRMAGDTPGWNKAGAIPIEISPRPNTDFVLEELYQGKIRVFDVVLIDHNDQSKTIVDARVLPEEIVVYEIRGGKPVMKKDWLKKYSVTWRCRRENSEERIIGLWRPEPGKERCNHWSAQVIRAWAVNPESGVLKDVPTEGVACRDPIDGDIDCE